MLCTSCPGLCLEAAGMVMLHGAGTELKCGWRDVTGLFLDVVEDSKKFYSYFESTHFLAWH